MPSSCSSAAAVCPRCPTSQYTTNGPAPSSSRCSRSESIGMFREAGMAPAACSSAVRTSISSQPSASRSASSCACTTSQSPLRTFSAMYPSRFTGSLADENGGAYASSRSASRSAVSPPAIAVAITSIRLSTPLRPTICAPRIVPSARVEQQLRRHARRARVVGGVVERVRVDRPVLPSGCVEPPLVPPDGGRHHVEDLHDRSAQRRHRVRGPSGDVVGDAPALAVRDVGERDERRRPRDRVGLLGDVADGVDVGVARSVRVVDCDAAARAELDPRRPRELGVGPDADRAEHQVGRQRAAVRRASPSARRSRPPSRRFRRARRARSSSSATRIASSGSNGVRTCGAASTIVTPMPRRDEVLRHLEPDEPGTDDDRVGGRNVDVGREPGGVFHRAQRAYPVVARDRRANRRGAHAQHEPVVLDRRSRRRSSSSGRSPSARHDRWRPLRCRP